jgi:hypothetical protein
MGTNRKDIYSGMVTGPIGGFGKITREREIVPSPMRSGTPKRKKKPKKEEFLKEKSMEQKALMQKSFERTFAKRIDDLDDETLDILFPEGDDSAVDNFISGIDEKWIFDTAGAFIRRALTGRRRRRRKSADIGLTAKVKTGPCWDGYEQVGMKKGKGGKMVPNCVPIGKKSLDKPRLRDPKGGLTAAGRAHFKRTEGSNLKPGVKGAADTPEKMRRKGSFLTRFFTNPSGPMVGDNGKPTRLALSAAAWGEPVPKNRSDAAKLAAKGRRLLERYENTKKKK